MDTSGPPIREVVQSVVHQPWYSNAVFNKTTVGSVYTFTAPSGAPSLGFTVSQRFVSRGVHGVVGVEVDLAHLQGVIRGFGFDADAASVFIAEQATNGAMQVVAASAGARFELAEDRAVTRAVAQHSSATLVAETSANIDEEGGLATVRGKVLTAGQGVERVWMSVSNITVGALQWDLIVAFRQATFTVGIRDWQDVAFLVGGGSIIIIGFVTVSVRNPPPLPFHASRPAHGPGFHQRSRRGLQCASEWIRACTQCAPPRDADPTVSRADCHVRARRLPVPGARLPRRRGWTCKTCSTRTGPRPPWPRSSTAWLRR